MTIVVDTNPRSKTYGKGYRKRKGKARKPKSKSMFAKSSPLPLGKSFRFKTRYCDKNIQVNPGAGGVPSTHVFSLNGLYDPDITGIGHQPLGFDQLMVMYDHYTVVSARARVTFQNTDTTYQQLCIMQIKDTATTSTDSNEILENGNVKYCTLGIHGSGQAIAERTISVSPSKFFGRKVMEGDKYQGTVSTNPSDQLYLHLQIGPTEGVDADIVDCTVEIEYVAILTEPKQFSQS